MMKTPILWAILALTKTKKGVFIMSRIPDILWNKIETILPRKKSLRGRPEMDAKTAIEGIFYLLRTGGQWCELPRYFGPPSTVHGKFLKWARMGLFQLILKEAKEFYLSHSEENVWYAIDASHSKAPLANFSGKSPVDRGKRGVKKTILVDRRGAPLAVVIGAGNIHDSKFFEEILPQIPSKELPQILAADSAYDCKKLKKLSKNRNIAFIPTTNRRRNKDVHVVYPPHRWIVERTFGWLASYLGLKTCWTKTKIAYESFCFFAASIQLFRMV